MGKIVIALLAAIGAPLAIPAAAAQTVLATRCSPGA